MSTPIISIHVSAAEIGEMAADLGIDPEVALARVYEAHDAFVDIERDAVRRTRQIIEGTYR